MQCLDARSTCTRKMTIHLPDPCRVVVSSAPSIQPHIRFQSASPSSERLHFEWSTVWYIRPDAQSKHAPMRSRHGWQGGCSVTLYLDAQKRRFLQVTQRRRRDCTIAVQQERPYMPFRYRMHDTVCRSLQPLASTALD